MLRRVVRLVNDFLVVFESKPFQSVKNRARWFVSRTLQIGVFDAKQEFPACVFGVKIIEKRGSRWTDMQITRRRRSKSYSCCHKRYFDPNAAGSAKFIEWFSGFEFKNIKAIKSKNLIADKHIRNSKLKWRRWQDSNLWKTFDPQQFSKLPLSATQPHLRACSSSKSIYNFSRRANFVKPRGIYQSKPGLCQAWHI